MNCILKKSLWLLILIVSLLSSKVLSAQEYDYLRSAQKGKIDTLALETSKEVLKETVGLLEKEIDPDSYICGPNDQFTVSIVSADPKMYKIKISPAGKLIIPYVGMIDVKGKTLTEVEKLAVNKVKEVFNVKEVNVALTEIRQFKVTVSGAVRKPSIVAATAADRASEVIEKAGGLKQEASLRNIILLRENQEPIGVDLIGYFRTNDPDDNPVVLGGDHIIVPPSGEDVNIGIYGEVAKSDVFEYKRGDSLSHLFQFGLGFLETAMLDSVEISRKTDKGIKTWIVDLSSWRDNYPDKTNLKNDIPLKAGDQVFVRKNQTFEESERIVIEGEVKLPGYYAIEKEEERLSDLINRAGGFTKFASLEGAKFIRTSVWDKEDPEMNRLYNISRSEMTKDEKIYFQARKNEQKGLMSIDFRNVLDNPEHPDNVILQHKDSVFVPEKKNFINVQGRVNKPGLVVYNPEYNYADYINLAGGFGYRADENSILVVKPKGEKYDAESGNYELEPGDNILVPPEEDTDMVEVITMIITATTQILTILAILTTLKF